jgi:hypothetical protein
MKMFLTIPPNFEDIKKAFTLPEDMHVFFTYGDAIYNPSAIQISPDLIRHEETHIEQQNASTEVAVLWWQRYLKDPVWRIEQEAEAYGAQYAFMCQGHKDRNYRARYLHGIATHLSSEMYGKAIDFQGARKMILEFANNGKVIHKPTS